MAQKKNNTWGGAGRNQGRRPVYQKSSIVQTRLPDEFISKLPRPVATWVAEAAIERGIRDGLITEDQIEKMKYEI